MFGIGPPELIVIFLIILILFGAKRLPELARSLGRSINEFKNASQNIKDDLDLGQEEQQLPKEKKNKATESTEKSQNSTSENKNKENLAG